MTINPYPATIFLSCKCCLLFTSAAYTLQNIYTSEYIHFRIDFITEAHNMDPDQIAPLSNNINPDQTAPNGAIEATYKQTSFWKEEEQKTKVMLAF